MFARCHDDSFPRDDQEKHGGFDKTIEALLAPQASARLSLASANASSSVATFPAAAENGVTIGAPSSVAGTPPLMHVGPHQENLELLEGDATKTNVVSTRSAGPTRFEQDYRTSPARCLGRRMSRPAHTTSRSQRRWPFSRSPSPVRSGEAVTLCAPPPRRESSLAPAVPQVDGRTPKVCCWCCAPLWPQPSACV